MLQQAHPPKSNLKAEWEKAKGQEWYNDGGVLTFSSEPLTQLRLKELDTVSKLPSSPSKTAAVLGMATLLEMNRPRLSMMTWYPTTPATPFSTIPIIVVVVVVVVHDCNVSIIFWALCRLTEAYKIAAYP